MFTICACVLQVLLRALRDFNLGKLTSDDTSIFLGLLNDLFPRTLELVPRAVDKIFEDQCRKSARTLRYQPDDMFCLKISQVLFRIRVCMDAALPWKLSVQCLAAFFMA
jgi:Hydrolytic ATP binding site of dynein motor region